MSLPEDRPEKPPPPPGAAPARRPRPPIRRGPFAAGAALSITIAAAAALSSGSGELAILSQGLAAIGTSFFLLLPVGGIVATHAGGRHRSVGLGMLAGTAAVLLGVGLCTLGVL